MYPPTQALQSLCNPTQGQSWGLAVTVTSKPPLHIDKLVDHQGLTYGPSGKGWGILLPLEQRQKAKVIMSDQSPHFILSQTLPTAMFAWDECRTEG
jgi:hypothetical protein